MNPLRCDEVKNSLVEYLEFELPLTDREQFHAHLARCAQCRAVHDELQQVLTEAKSIDVVYPPHAYWQALAENVLQEVKRLQSTTAQLPDDVAPDGKAGVNPDSAAVGYDEKVIAFSRIKDRKSKPRAIRLDTPATGNSAPVSPEQNKQAKANRWPRIALPIAAAVLIGIAATLSLLEREIAVPDTIGFQAQIHSGQSLADLVGKVAPLPHPSNQFGFARQQALLNEFAVGSMFSEAKAYASSGKLIELKSYLALIKAALSNEPDPQHNIIDALSRLQQRLESPDDLARANQELTRLLNEYAAAIKRQDSQRYTMVRAGAWLFDYALAVLAQDDASVRQFNQLAQLTMDLQTIGVPPGVIKSLNKIQAIANQPSLTPREYQLLLGEIENIRSLLG